MTLIANTADAGWTATLSAVAGLLHARKVHPARAVVLVPYAQLIAPARAAWVELASSSHSFFMPRFETTMNWAGVLPGYDASSADLQMDAAIDSLTAARLLERAGLAAQQNDLASALLESAWSLARVAAAQVPSKRLAWGEALSGDIGASMDSPALAFELALARIALAWAASSSYPTDVLFSPQVLNQIDLLVVIDGFQSDPLLEALKAHFGQRAASLPLSSPKAQGMRALHTAADLEAEAHLAAACVLAHLAQGRSPVALVAQDRLLTRRVRAMLAAKGVALRDETGWKLSTTRAAATLMGLLRALPWDASADAVIDWLKNAPAFDAQAVTLLEATLRRIGVRQWRAVHAAIPADRPELVAITAQVASVTMPLQSRRALSAWLQDLRLALENAGQWAPLTCDAAGMAVIAALHMDDDFAQLGNPAMSVQDFSRWVNQTLEAAKFEPAHPPVADVVILPLAQLLGRQLQAVVMPGCDEQRLPVSPEPTGVWTAAQRALLGLPSRDQLDQAQRAAWRHALTSPHLDLLWRLGEGGESLMPSGLVQELQLEQPQAMAEDRRPLRLLTIEATPQPQPTGQALPITQLSASAYEDLRRCPYRFFALRQLKLQEADELESELGKRDFGNWLHLLLHTFHEALKNESNRPLDQKNRALAAMLNIAAEEAKKALGLSAEEFLPFAASWPRVRDGYLDWLATHEASGARYVEGEIWKRMPLGSLELVGKLDRIDQMPDGSCLVMDYKTEPASTTKDRIKAAGEDTQLAFYAALLEDDTLAAAYVNLGEKEPTKTYAQAEIVEMRAELIGGILQDMRRIADGAPLPALGEGKACEFCAARGLCRKDFWS
jgi:ATP-dependent helicase/nuclease subunit B